MAAMSATSQQPEAQQALAGRAPAPAHTGAQKGSINGSFWKNLCCLCPKELEASPYVPAQLPPPPATPPAPVHVLDRSAGTPSPAPSDGNSSSGTARTRITHPQEDDLYIIEESQRSLSDYPSSHDSAPFVRSWPQASLSTDSNLTIYSCRSSSVLPPALDRALTPPFAGLAAGEGAGGHAVDSQGGHAGQELEADYESMEKPAPEAPPQAAAAFSDLSNSQLMGTRRAYLRDSPPTPATQSPLPPAAAAAQKVATLLLLQPHSQQENANQNELFCAEQLAPSPHATPQLSPQPSVQPGPGEPFRQLSINVGGGGGGCSPPKQLPPAHALGGPALLPNLTVMLPEARAAAAAELLKSSSSSETPPGWREYFRRQAELRDAADTAAAEGLPAATARRPATAAVRRAGALPARPPARGAGGVRDQGHQGSGTAKEFVITLGGGASATGGGGGGDACSFSRLKSPAPLRPALEPLLPLSSDKEAAGGAAWLKYSPPVAGGAAGDVTGQYFDITVRDAASSSSVEEVARPLEEMASPDFGGCDWTTRHAVLHWLRTSVAELPADPESPPGNDGTRRSAAPSSRVQAIMRK